MSQSGKVFPTIQKPSFPLKEQIEDNQLTTEFENGFEQTRARYTRRRKTWQGIFWNAMSQADKDTLEEFYKTATAGGADDFDWTHPYSSTTHAVRFVGPPKFELFVPGRWKVEITLREV